jgi:hypothetical protein
MYLLDSNVFIEAKNKYYGFDFVPAFWEWLVEANQANRVASVQKVAEELSDGGDQLADWVRDRDEGFFLPPDDRAVASLTTVSEWVTGSGRYDGAAITPFLQDSSADYFLIAHAHAHDHVVVTLEVSSEARKRVKIPDVCAALDVECTTPFAMLRDSQARFVNQA